MRSLSNLRNVILTALACAPAALGCGGRETMAGGGEAGAGGTAGASGMPGSGDTGGTAGTAGSWTTGSPTTSSYVAGGPTMMTLCFAPSDAWQGFGGGAPPAIDASTGDDDAGDGDTAIQCPDAGPRRTWGCGGAYGPPWVADGKCCYQGEFYPCSGRPLVVEGEARVAPAAMRDDWCAASDARYRASVDRVLARAWLDEALLEHASVASFARVTLDLLALGAPPDLIASSQKAALDEIEHARLCFGLASRYAGVRVGPGSLASHDVAAKVDLVAFAIATVRDGCVGETLAALVATERARLARDPEVRAALRRIARDETRHAALAWRMVKWAIGEGGRSVRDAVARAFADELERMNAPLDASRPLARRTNLLEHGIMDGSEQRELMRRGAREIVEPCALALA
jgi:hypothetical protein